MNKEEIATLREAASHLAAAAALLVFVNHEKEATEFSKKARELLAFADECGKG